MRPSSRPESRPGLEQSRHGGDDGAVGSAQQKESGLAVLVLSQRHISCLALPEQTIWNFGFKQSQTGFGVQQPVS